MHHSVFWVAWWAMHAHSRLFERPQDWHAPLSSRACWIFTTGGCGHATPTQYLLPAGPAVRLEVPRHQLQTRTDTGHTSLASACNSCRRVVTSRTLNLVTHNLPAASTAGRWHVPPLGTALWLRPTLSHGRGHLDRTFHAPHAFGSPSDVGASVMPTPRCEQNEMKTGRGSAFVSPSASASAPVV